MPTVSMPGLLRSLQRHLLADTPPLSARERARSAVAALAGLLLASGILAVLPVDSGVRALVAPIGATSVILFSLPHSPLGQPWPVAGGLLLSAAIGLACGTWIAPAWLAPPVAVALAIWVMNALRCLHPPGGALALGMALVPTAGWAGLAAAALNVGAILVAVLLVNNLVPGRRYPHGAPATVADPLPPPERAGVEHEDLQFALARMDSFLDISEEDLVAVYNLALGHAFERHVTLTCGEIMTTPPVCVEFGTGLREAWRILRENHVKALPVVDRGRRVIGLLTLEDFLRHVTPAESNMVDQLRAFLSPSGTSHSSRPETVGQVMSERFLTALTTDGIGKVASLLAARGHQQAIPIVDPQDRIAGILSQTDLLVLLYHRRATGLASPRPA
ncbi:MAG TPA: HPP family protein [Rhodocyclaceae bacterium]|nr:HPP family protein [Rhodocyclaceae bacterium]